jgi:hypothetical protein
MKLFLFILLSSLLSTTSTAQDSWKLVYMNQVKLQTSKEDPSENIVRIRKTSLAKKGYFHLTYKEDPPKKDWKREIIIFDTADNELFRQKGSQLKLQNATLKKLFKKSDTLEIYTISLPADPKAAALVRVRRVHLYTLILK